MFAWQPENYLSLWNDKMYTQPDKFAYNIAYEKCDITEMKAKIPLLTASNVTKNIIVDNND